MAPIACVQAQNSDAQGPLLSPHVHSCSGSNASLSPQATAAKRQGSTMVAQQEPNILGTLDGPPAAAR